MKTSYGFTVKRESEERNSDFFLPNECRMKTHSYGFTLIETMVAVTILTLSIVGPMTAANRAIVGAETARDQLSASYLAQEGVEYVRAVRDDQYLAVYPASTGSAWTNFLNSSTLAGCRTSACTLGALQTNGTLCLGSSCTSPFSIVTNGTKYTRTVQVIDASTNGATDVRVVSKVTWSFHTTPYSVTITEHLTPWQ